MEDLILYAAPLLAVGGAWGGAKVALNGTRERVKEIQDDLSSHITEEHALDMETHARIARLETKIDILVEKI